MAESEDIYKSQIDVVVNTVIKWYKCKSGAEKHVKRLGDRLVEEHLLENSGWEKIKERKQFILVDLLNHIDAHLSRNLHAAETVMDWMSNNSQGRNDWDNLREKVLSFAIEILDYTTEMKSIGHSVYKTKFLEYDFETSEKGASTIFEAISASLNHCKSADEIKTTVKETLEKCKTRPCQWNGGPSVESWIGFRSQKWESGHPFVLHYLSDIYEMQIHVICLLTTKAVCFYPKEDMATCKRIYLGRVEPKKYVPLHTKKKGKKGDYRDNQDKETIHLRKEIERLTSELNDARQEIEQLRGQIKQLEMKRANIARLLYSPDQHSEMDYNSLKKENERLLETIEKEKSKLSKLEVKYGEQKEKENIQSNKIRCLETKNKKQQQDLEAAEEKRKGDLQKMSVACENKLQELREEFKNIIDGEKGNLPSPTCTPVLPPIRTESAQVAKNYTGKSKRKNPTILQTLSKSADT